MNKIIPNSPIESLSIVAEKLMKLYWSPLYKYVSENKSLLKSATGFLLKPERIAFYFGKTHLAVEYFGPERIDELKPKGNVQLVYHDLTLSDENFFEQIIGFKYDSTSKVEYPLPNWGEDLILPTNRGMDKLIELKWNFDAQNSILGFNTGNFYIPRGQFSRFVNSFFFDADEKGLKTRHVKWIDFIPLEYDDSNSEYDRVSIRFGYYDDELVKRDAHYVYPLPTKADFKFSKLQIINRFIEIIGNIDTAEPKITSFLSEKDHNFILTMSFLAKEVYPQLKCEWQSEVKEPIQPDFFVVQPNGYANIVEFKLPYLKSNAITGKSNRETFSAEINSYISQTRSYKSYFEDPNNRIWFEKKYGFKVHHPKRILVLGRKWDFKRDEWKEIISDYNDIEIITYEDLVDGVVSQFYM